MAQLTADEIQSAYQRGLEQQASRNYDEALQTFGKILKANPGIAEAHYQVGRILCATDRATAALPHLKKAAALRPGEQAVWTAWAEAVALGGNRAEEADFLLGLRPAPIPPAARIWLQDRFGARRSSSAPATGGLRPADIQRLLRLMNERRYAEAERDAAAAVKRHPTSAAAFNILATAQALQKKRAVAEANYRTAIRLDPNFAEAYDNLGHLYIETQRDAEAADCLRKGIMLAPGRVQALVAFGSLLTKTGNAAAALPLLERAVAIDGRSVAAHRALGNALTRVRRYDEAEKTLEKALELAGTDVAEVVALLAQAQARQGKDDLAMQNLDRALELDPNLAIAVGGKASLLQTLGEFAAAETWFRKSFEIDPGNGENYRLFIASHKTKPGDPVIAQMLARYDDRSISAGDRMNLGFAIAKALEDVKDYSKVFRYLEEANRLMRAAKPYHISRRLTDIRLVKEAFADFDWKGARIDGVTDFAPIFVTGMPRSGTTLIEQIISSHSTVEGAGEVGEAARAAHELIVLNGRARAMGRVPEPEIATLGRSLETFIRARFPDAPRITDKSIQSYMFIGLLKLAMPNARFVIVRRDPRDNLLSIYKNKFPDDTHLYAYDQRDLAITYATFVEMVDFWRERVPDWFYEVQYEDLVANPEAETRELIAACGLPWEDACLKPQDNERKVETLSVFQARQPISKASVKAWQRYEKELAPMLDELRKRGLVAD
jgi:tetratricopeptide (TPR) repeat protein